MRRLLMAAVALITVFATLAVLVAQDVRALLEVDRVVGAALRPQLDGTFQVDVLQVLTAPGLTVFRLVVLWPVAILLAVRRQRRLAGFIVLTAVAVAPLTTLFKELVARVRPTADDPLVAASGLSYPSGHAAGAATLAGVLLVVLWPVVSRRWRPWLAGALVLGALCVAWTRIALGVHYLSDVVGGLALGTAVVLLSMLAFGLDRSRPGEVPGGEGSDKAGQEG
ncbi:MAG: phosphatase PAP2 family protein [Actinomycetota bacterium]|nr:phosphatase PAP2 family protein [Actinomycetota bacterium]